MAHKQWDRASEAYQGVLKADPDNVYALVGEARLCAGQKRWTRAIDLLQRAQKRLPPKTDVMEVAEWHVVGPFANPGDGGGLEIAYPPEKEVRLDAIYDGRPGAVSAAKGAMATLRKGCMTCHRMCKVSLPKAMAMGKMSLPETPAEIPAFVAGLKGMKSLMMAHQMACGTGIKAAEAGDVEAAALAGASMKAIQLGANGMASKNQKFVAAGKVFSATAAALEAVDRVPEEIGWQKMSRDEVLHLERRLPIDNVVFYGLATISSDTERAVELRVGSDDGCKVWFNEQHVWTNRARRPVNPDQDRIIVKVRKGKNKLLMKLDQGGMHYGMGARIVRAMNVTGDLRFAKQEYEKIKNNAFVRISARGLKPESQRQFWVYKKGRCVKKGLAGRLEVLPPGKYDIRVGLPSGYVARGLTLEKGRELTVPTGLFTFKQVTPPDLASTVPQKLHEAGTGKYLTTGYQGMTARLLAGKYDVRFQDLHDAEAALAFGPWHVLGVFPNPKGNKGLGVKYPPEENLVPDAAALKKTYRQGGLSWKRLEGYPEANLAAVVRGWGVAYATAAVESEQAQDVELVLTFRSGVKVWLNGKRIGNFPPPKRAYIYRRVSVFTALKPGRNVLFVKTLRGNNHWPLSAVAIKWQTYRVEVVADAE